MKDFVQIFSSFVTALATILAGVWAYYRFVKGRVFTPRLTLDVKARRVCIQGVAYLLSTLEVSNVGLSRINIESADLRVCSLVGNAGSDGASIPRRVSLGTFNVLLAHSWIESGEMLKEQTLITLPADHNSAVLIDFRVVSEEVSLTAVAIAEPELAQEANDGA